MKKFLLLVLFFPACTNMFLPVINWKDIAKTRPLPYSEVKTITIGDPLYRGYLDTVRIFECISPMEDLFVPRTILQKVSNSIPTIISKNEIFCESYCFEDNPNEKYFVFEKLTNIEQTQMIFLGVSENKIKKIGIFEKTSRGLKKNMFLLDTFVPVKVQKREEITRNIYIEELIFGGIANNSVVFYYREYFNGLPNTAGSLTFYYDYNEILKEKKIKFKGLEFEIQEIDKQKIKFYIKN